MTTAVYKTVEYKLQGLISSIETGDIGLPEIQRPFVWPKTKIRNLFDSMYRGYPVGYFLFWANPGGKETKQIGMDKKQQIPSRLIVDGQQRLTSLYAVMRGVPVLNKDFAQETVEIAFNPLEETFAVADATTKKNHAFIPNISQLWAEGVDSYSFITDFLAKLEVKQPLTEDEKKRIPAAIQKVYNLTHYSFTALEIAAEVDEVQVAEVFVRINSQGKASIRRILF